VVVGRRRRLSAAAAAALVRVCSFSERERDEAIRHDVVDVIVDADGGGLLWWTQGKKTLSKRKTTVSTLSCGKGPRKRDCIVVGVVA
jgi:hypothetical protein